MSAEAREMYRARSWRIFPLKANSKDPRVPWTKEYKGDWADTDNIGVVLGAKSRDLVDFDCDWPEVSSWAGVVFGRDKTATFGRESKPRSHYLFQTQLQEGRVKFDLPKSFLALNVPDEHALTVGELRGNGCYTMFPPSMHPSGERVEFENEAQVAAIDPALLKRGAGVACFLAVCQRFWPGEGGRHDAALALSGVLYWAGWSKENVTSFIEAMCRRTGDDQPKDRVRCVEDTFKEGRPKSCWKKLCSAFGFPDDTTPAFARWLEMSGALVVEQLNDRFAVIRDGSKVRIGIESMDPAFGRSRWDLMSRSDFRLYLREDDCAVSEWLSHPNRREYLNGFIFDPSGREHEGFLNLWKGWAVEPRPGDWSRLRAHIYDVLGDGNEEHGRYIERWLAWMFQNPQHRAEVALVLRGGKGTGKGTLGYAIMTVVGQHAIQVSSPSLMTGRFNAHMRDCIFFFADEAFWAGDKQGEGQLKRIITEDTLVVEAKGRDVVVTRNMLHILISSNEDWVVPATTDERRFAIFDVSDARRGDTAYFDALRAEIRDGGAAAMLHDLLAMGLGSWHPRDLPKTKALADQIKQSEPPEKALLRRILHVGQLPGNQPEHDHAPNELMFPEFRKALDQEPFGRVVTSAKAGRFLASIPGMLRDNNGREVTGFDHMSGQTKVSRCIRYVMPPLSDVREWFDPREEWAAPFEWEAPAAEDRSF